MPDETLVEAQETEKNQEHREGQTTFSEYLESLLVTVILALFGTSFIVQAFKIPSASMEGTLLIGDHLLVNKFVFAAPAHGMKRSCRTGNWNAATLSFSSIRSQTTSISSSASSDCRATT